MKRLLTALLLLACIQSALPADESLPAGTVKRGTLANAQLIADAKIGVASQVGALGCTKLGDVDTYVTAMPSGEPGKKSWKELWIVSGCDKKFPVYLSFIEDATGATWSIYNPQ
jgi:hypothetical protein